MKELEFKNDDGQRLNPRTHFSQIDGLDDQLKINMPPGGIIMWSGTVSNVPEGWLLCDGTKGTPDLRDRFIVGAGSTYNPSSIGGNNTVAITTAQMPQHNHGSTGSTTPGNTGNPTTTLSAASAGAHEHLVGMNSSGAPADRRIYGDVLGGSTSILLMYPLSSSNHGVLSIRNGAGYTGGPYAISNGAHTHTVTNSAHVHTSAAHTHSTGDTGSGAAHENRPPYYALCFIMKE